LFKVIWGLFGIKKKQQTKLSKIHKDIFIKDTIDNKQGLKGQSRGLGLTT
jgi:hypothetical protein